MYYYSNTLKSMVSSTITETIAHNVDAVLQGGFLPGDSFLDIKFPYPKDAFDCLDLLTHDILEKSSNLKLGRDYQYWQ